MKKTIIQPHRSSIGMDANIVALIIGIGVAVFLWLPYASWVAFAIPLVFFMLEKNSGFVKFIAMSVLIIAILGSAISLIIQIILWIVQPRVNWSSSYWDWSVSGSWAAFNAFIAIRYVFSSIFSLLMIYMVYLGMTYQQVELPIIGPLAVKAAGKLGNAGYYPQGGNQYNPNANQQYGANQYNQPPAQPAPGQYQQPPGQYQQPPAQYQQPPVQPAPGQYQQPPAQQPPPQYQQPAQAAPPQYQQPPVQSAPGQYQQPPPQQAPGQYQPPPNQPPNQ